MMKEFAVTGEWGRVILITGIGLSLLGLAMIVAEKIPGIGKLPGDILIRRGNFTFYFPLVTSLLISLILTLLLNWWNRR